MSEYEEFQALYNGHLARIEGMARRLVPVEAIRFDDLWPLQLELLDYRIELQEALTAENAAKAEVGARLKELARAAQADTRRPEIIDLQRRLDDAKHRIAICKYARALARLLGDTIAWFLLGRNVRYILAHRSNKPHGNVPPRDALVGMVMTAQQLAPVHGLPILHDLTNWLRTGDITFSRPDRAPTCVEVKTREPIRVGDGQLYVMSVDSFSPPSADSPGIAPVTAPAEAEGDWPDRLGDPSLPDDAVPRAVRQLRRMRDAAVWSRAEPNTVVPIRGWNHLIVVCPRAADDYHSDVMREVVDAAMRDGYASVTVDGAMQYFAVRTDRPLWYPWEPRADLPHRERLWSDARAGGMWDAEGRTPLDVYHGGSWEHLGGTLLPHIEPFLLQHYLSPEAKLEMLHGRLTVGVLIDLRKVYEALVAAGLDARLPAGNEEAPRTLIPVVARMTLPDGRVTERTLDIARWIGGELIHHCLALPAFVREIGQAVEQVTERDGYGTTRPT